MSDTRHSPAAVTGSLSTPRHAASKPPVTTEGADDDDDDDELSVYRPDLHLDDVGTLHDPTTASAAYRKVMSGWSTLFVLCLMKSN